VAQYARHWARFFTFVTTSDIAGVRKFRAAGLPNAIYSPFGCNHRVFTRRTLPKTYDVTFVGQYHPVRAWIIQDLRRRAIDVRVWGNGWSTERLTESGMVDVFNQTRINLNLSNTVSFDLRYLAALHRPFRDTLRAWRTTARVLRGGDAKVVEQVKGRHFEIPACGGFQLSYYVEGLEAHFRIRDEIALYSTVEELAEKIRYYLDNDQEREAVAEAGFRRATRDHTMDQRFIQLFQATGLLTPSSVTAQ
jgi:spore maturation protein CgeB